MNISPKDIQTMSVDELQYILCGGTFTTPFTQLCSPIFCLIAWLTGDNSSLKDNATSTSATSIGNDEIAFSFLVEVRIFLKSK